jgi:hypothetical protein
MTINKADYETLTAEDNAFLALVCEGEAVVADVVSVDDGQIQFGSCDKIQFAINTAYGDGLYPVWVTKSGRYAVIELDMFKIQQLENDGN